MPLSDEQVMELMGKTVRIIDPPPDKPELLNKIGRIAMIVDDTKCVLMLEDGSGATVDIEQLQPVQGFIYMWCNYSASFYMLKGSVLEYII